MTHTWKSGGSHGQWVLHNGTGKAGDASDSIGVGQDEDVLGPFSSQKLAWRVATALNSAYAAGLKDGEVKVDTGRKRAHPRRKQPAVREEDPGNGGFTYPGPEESALDEGFGMPGYGD